MKFDRYGRVVDESPEARARAREAEAWWAEWRAARLRQHARDPDDMTPAWHDPNAPATRSVYPASRYDRATFEDETGR